MKIYASSGDEGGGGITVPDQPADTGGGGAMDTAALIQQQMQPQQQQRDAIAQAMMAQAMQGQANPWGQTFSPRGQPSGSITDVGWMNALQPGQGGVTVGGQPGTPPGGGSAFTGGGSMTTPNANYWNAQGGGGGGDPNRRIGGWTPAEWMQRIGYVPLEGGGPGNSGAFGGMAPGSNGISQGEMQQAIADVNNSRGTPQRGDPRGDPNAPQGLTGFEAYSRAQQDYNQPTFTPSYQQPTTFGDRYSEFSPAPPMSVASQTYSFPGFDAEFGYQPGITAAAQQAAQNAADDAEADQADEP